MPEEEDPESDLRILLALLPALPVATVPLLGERWSEWTGDASAVFKKLSFPFSFSLFSLSLSAAAAFTMSCPRKDGNLVGFRSGVLVVIVIVTIVAALFLPLLLLLLPLLPLLPLLLLGVRVRGNGRGTELAPPLADEVAAVAVVDTSVFVIATAAGATDTGTGTGTDTTGEASFPPTNSIEIVTLLLLTTILSDVLFIAGENGSIFCSS
jgi:prepilin signal peptidase PulO-like enzyme (type II secretory pathway)